MKKILLIFIVIGAVVSGCEKYTLNKIYGFYTITSYRVNDADSLDSYRDSLGVDFHFFYNDAYYNNICEVTGKRIDNNNFPVIFRWELRENAKKMLITASSGAIGTGPIGRDKTPEWSIIKLRRRFFELKTNFLGKEYLIKLEKK